MPSPRPGLVPTVLGSPVRGSTTIRPNSIGIPSVAALLNQPVIARRIYSQREMKDPFGTGLNAREGCSSAKRVFSSQSSLPFLVMAKVKDLTIPDGSRNGENNSTAVFPWLRQHQKFWLLRSSRLRGARQFPGPQTYPAFMIPGCRLPSLH